eukprot:1157510-Pelagomonas_calceolata.AAC.4
MGAKTQDGRTEGWGQGQRADARRGRVGRQACLRGAAACHCYGNAHSANLLMQVYWCTTRILEQAWCDSGKPKSVGEKGG